MQQNLLAPSILMTADTVGGVWTYALELARSLGELGCRVTLATMGAPLTHEQQEEARSVPALEVYESSFKLEWMNDPWNDVRRAGDWLLALEESVRPSLIHLNNFAHGSVSWQAPVLVVGHSCVLSWWRSVKGGEAPAEWDRYRTEVAAGLRAASLVVAPTQAMLAALEEHYGLFPRKLVIYNGRDPSPFNRGPKEEFVLAAGRLWDEAKNVASLASVAPRLPWPVRLAGDARHPDGRVASFNNVRVLGRLASEELAVQFSRASIYALPARYEPFGLSALEAAISGCALVLGDIPSLREVWRDAAVFVPPGDAESLLAALEMLIGDSAMRTALARSAQRRAREFTPRRMAESYLAAYRELIENRASASEPEEVPVCA